MSPGVAVVTGAARGIGAAVARALSAEGWRLVLVDVCADDPALPYGLSSRRELDGVAEETGALACVGDVRRQGDLDEAVALATRSWGGVDAAVAAAGVVAGGTGAWLMSEDAWRAVLSVNLEGVWRLSRASVPAMLARPEPRSGRFVAVASVAGSLGLPLLAAYSAAKHGVIGLVRSLAAELGPTGITANVVAPGSTRTAVLDASAGVYGLASVEEFTQHHLVPRLIEPDEIARAVAWLLSPGSGAVTGSVVSVDAGMSAS